MTTAGLSDSLKYTICGTCGRSLARRDRIVEPDGRVIFDLVWDDDWHMAPGQGTRDWGRFDAMHGTPIDNLPWEVRMTLGGPYLRRTRTAIDRLMDGHAPVRHHARGGQRFEGDIRAVCPFCNEMNEIIRKRLKLT